MGLEEWLAAVERRGGRTWKRILTSNDVGATGSHQAGVLIPLPKLRELFPDLIERTRAGEKNPDERLPARLLPTGVDRSLRVVYYNGRVLGQGTRNEGRITGWAGALNAAGAGRPIVFAVLEREGRRWMEVWVGDSGAEEKRSERASGREIPDGSREWPGDDPREMGGVCEGASGDSGWNDTRDPEGGGEERMTGSDDRAGADSDDRMKRYPRLLSGEVRRLLREYGKEVVTPAELPVRELLEWSGTWIPATFGEPVATEVLEEIRDGMRACMREARKREKRAHRRFDECGAIWWARHAKLMPDGEGLDEGVWAWIATLLVPDVVIWRFGSANPHRFLGGVRNTIRRLWTRGMVLDRGETSGEKRRWELLKSLTEDAMVQIFERPGLSGNRKIARAIAEQWFGLVRDFGHNGMEEIHRKAMRALLATAAVVSIDYLAETGDIDKLISRCYERALSGEVE